jgi:SAM-dependent methyltransferase
MSECIERLAFGAESAVAAREAAIHLGRYLAARPFCAGKRVLDVACGEGYGAYFLAEHWGSAHVDGVDIAEDAIEAARERFASPRVTFHTHDAAAIGDCFPAASFDLIVSLETLEHLHEPVKVLNAFKKLIKPDGVIVISCPNDHVYYAPDESNQFHTRKYTFGEFRTLTESVLGEARAFQLGGPLSGFCNVAADEWLESSAQGTEGFKQSLRGPVTSFAVPPQDPVNWETCSYYLGFWGPAGLLPEPTAVMYPTTLAAHFPEQRDALVKRLQDEFNTIRSQQAALRQERDNALSELRTAGMRAAAFEHENEFVRGEVRSLNAALYQANHERDACRQQLEKFDRLKRSVPRPLVSLLRRLLRRG